MAHYEPPHQDLRCLQIQLFSSLVVKELHVNSVIATIINTPAALKQPISGSVIHHFTTLGEHEILFDSLKDVHVVLSNG